MIILHCVREEGKLRIKFHTYIDHEGKRFANVYNNKYNCMFPKDIRQPGRFYEIPDENMKLVTREGVAPFYQIKKSNIRILTEDEVISYTPLQQTNNNSIARPETVYEIADCVICLSEPSALIFLPCAHQCVCAACNNTLKRTKHVCPICRAKITGTI